MKKQLFVVSAICLVLYYSTILVAYTTESLVVAIILALVHIACNWIGGFAMLLLLCSFISGAPTGPQEPQQALIDPSADPTANQQSAFSKTKVFRSFLLVV
ncbi:MAG: hypothetical protein CMI53_00435 [Parcubacteria group bacterium]|jgi:hypothetical protein|nr:hypothetical protein [Parcubacteria group bacterium]|tara:strand:+ start:911 stop:1213 length:303 start_codon:yes stop_codon:yes gene_type:complete